MECTCAYGRLSYSSGCCKRLLHYRNKPQLFNRNWIRPNVGLQTNAAAWGGWKQSREILGQAGKRAVSSPLKDLSRRAKIIPRHRSQLQWWGPKVFSFNNTLKHSFQGSVTFNRNHHRRSIERSGRTNPVNDGLKDGSTSVLSSNLTWKRKVNISDLTGT